MLSLLVFGTQCGSEVRVESATDVSLVLGIGAKCANQLKSVTIEVQTAGQVDFKETIQVTSTSELPRRLKLLPSFIRSLPST